MNQDSFCIIMAGGIGKRFWPVSTRSCPKQFSDILCVGKSFIRQTYDRVSRLFDHRHILIITGKEYESITRRQIPEIPEENILKEPIPRNTATCITYAAMKIRKTNPDATMVIVPSDHFITDDAAYLSDLCEGIEFARSHGGLLTVGITPSRAETQYGYIQTKRQEKPEKIGPVKTFTEKPDADLAAKFLESGDFLWNAGIFIWRVDEILSEVHKHVPDMYQLFNQPAALNTPREQAFIDGIYSECPNLSIDVGILEKSSHVYVLRGSFGWSDVGTWHAYRTLMEKDGDGNSANSPHVLFRSSSNCIVNVPKRKKVIVHGANDLIIAENNNYLMVCHIKDEDRIKHFEEQLKYKK